MRAHAQKVGNACFVAEQQRFNPQPKKDAPLLTINYEFISYDIKGKMIVFTTKISFASTYLYLRRSSIQCLLSENFGTLKIWKKNSAGKREGKVS